MFSKQIKISAQPLVIPNIFQSTGFKRPNLSPDIRSITFFGGDPNTVKNVEERDKQIDAARRADAENAKIFDSKMANLRLLYKMEKKRKLNQMEQKMVQYLAEQNELKDADIDTLSQEARLRLALLRSAMLKQDDSTKRLIEKVQREQQLHPSTTLQTFQGNRSVIPDEYQKLINPVLQKRTNVSLPAQVASYNLLRASKGLQPVTVPQYQQMLQAEQRAAAAQQRLAPASGQQSSQQQQQQQQAASSVPQQQSAANLFQQASDNWDPESIARTDPELAYLFREGVFEQGEGEIGRTAERNHNHVYFTRKRLPRIFAMKRPWFRERPYNAEEDVEEQQETLDERREEYRQAQHELRGKEPPRSMVKRAVPELAEPITLSIRKPTYFNSLSLGK